MVGSMMEGTEVESVEGPPPERTCQRNSIQKQKTEIHGIEKCKCVNKGGPTLVGEDVADGLPPPEEGSPGRSSGKRTRNRTTADKCLRSSRMHSHHEAGKQNMGDGRWSATNGRCGKEHDGRDRSGEHGRAASGHTWQFTQGLTTGPEIIRRAFAQIFPAQPPLSQQIRQIAFRM